MTHPCFPATIARPRKIFFGRAEVMPEDSRWPNTFAWLSREETETPKFKILQGCCDPLRQLGTTALTLKPLGARDVGRRSPANRR